MSQRKDCTRFGAGLLPFHSPLLRESLLFSLPPPNDMLKFSGLSRLIRGCCFDWRAHSASSPPPPPFLYADRIRGSDSVDAERLNTSIQSATAARLRCACHNHCTPLSADCRAPIDCEHSIDCVVRLAALEQTWLDQRELSSRNVRSRCRCSMCLQFALIHAAGCAFHRPVSRVIHRSE